MKKYIIMIVLAQIVFGASSQDFEARKAELLKELEDLEAKNAQDKQITDLENRIKQLKEQNDNRDWRRPKNTQNTQGTQNTQNTNTQRNYQPNTQRTQPQNASRNYQPNTQNPQPYPTTQQPNTSPSTESKHITQAQRDAEVKKWFGKNRNGVLIGFSVGYMEIAGQSDYITTKSSFVPFGLRLGYQQFINFGSASKSPVGLRLYIDSHAGIADTHIRIVGIEIPSELKAVQAMGAYNMDLLLECNIPDSYSYVGIFGGVGYGFLSYGHTEDIFSILSSGAEVSMKGIFYNLGFGITLAAKHRFEFYYKILPKNKVNGNYLQYKINDLMMLAYQYTF